MAKIYLLPLAGVLALSILSLYQIHQLPLSPASGPSFWLQWVQEQRRPQQWPLQGQTPAVSADATQYEIGVGKADITGPVVELELMGYANVTQIGSGLRQRIYARTFIIGDAANDAERLVYMVLDTQSGDTAIRNGILEGLKALGKGYEIYTTSNIAVTGTHSHSGPAAWLNYLLPTITSKGFDRQSYQAIVDGAVLSIQRAHESLALGTLSFGTVELQDANINRSPFAYLANPAEERERYSSNADKFLTILKFTRSSDDKTMGILTWFPTHGTSMLGNNTLVSGDNKGVAADLFEKSVRGDLGVTENFVAGFSQSNVGDVSPNVEGAYCEDGSQQKCSFKNSTCGGKADKCHGRGPFFRNEDRGASSCYEIGRRQFAAARALYDSWESESTSIIGSRVKSFHTFQNMSGFKFELSNGTTVSTCSAALGYSFAAGTSDWPGSFDFNQGNNEDSNTNPFWRAVRYALREPSPEQVECQGVKPVLLDVGEVSTPYPWAPNIVDIQVFRVGQLFMIISPGEATTMAGRRWKAAIASNARGMTGKDDPIVVLGGPANTYTHYITTDAEYDIQRFEGASTLYGKHTLSAYINLTTSYLPYLSSSPPAMPLTAGPSPPDNRDVALSFIGSVWRDAAPFGTSFGDVIDHAPLTAAPGDTISVKFVGANPRNDLRLESSYALVEKLESNGRWASFLDDSDWDLVFHWQRENTLLGTSSVTLEWIIGLGVKGTYRMRYFGASKAAFTGTITQFSGSSGAIMVK